MTDRQPISGYEGLYEIDRDGRIFSLERIVIRGMNLPTKPKEVIVKQSLNQRGYPRVTLWKDGRRKRFLVHRLVALTFLPNPHNLPLVNHKDENKKNPCEWNLEWATHSYNVTYSKNREEEPQYMTVIPDLPMMSWTG